MFLQCWIQQVKARSSCVCGVGEKHSGEASSGPAGSPHQKGPIRRLPGDMPSPPLRQHVGCHPGASGEDVTGGPWPWLQTCEWWLTMFFEEKPLADAFHSEHCQPSLTCLPGSIPPHAVQPDWVCCTRLDGRLGRMQLVVLAWGMITSAE